MEPDVLKLNHIRFLSDDKPVCHWPARLGHDFVYNTRMRLGEERHCDECRQLILAHEVKEGLLEDKTFEKYGTRYVPPFSEYHRNRISPVRLMVFGIPVIISIVTLYFILSLVF